GELALPVDGRHERAALGIEADVHPRWRMRHGAIELRHAAVHRIHAPADEVAHHAGLAAIAPAHRLAHEAARPIGTDEVRRADGDRPIAIYWLCLCFHMVALVGEARDAPAVVHGGDALGVTPQYLLDVLLRHAVRQLGGAPGAGERAHH